MVVSQKLLIHSFSFLEAPTNFVIFKNNTLVYTKPALCSPFCISYVYFTSSPGLILLSLLFTSVFSRMTSTFKCWSRRCLCLLLHLVISVQQFPSPNLAECSCSLRTKKNQLCNSACYFETYCNVFLSDASPLLRAVWSNWPSYFIIG